MVALNLWSLTPVKLFRMFAVAEIEKDSGEQKGSASPKERQLSECHPGQGAGTSAMWGL